MRMALILLPMLLSSLCAPVYAATNWCTSANIIGCYLFENDTAFGSVEDSSSNNSHATNSGATYNGTSYTFDGTDNSTLENTDATNIPTTGDFTVYCEVDNSDIATQAFSKIFGTRDTGNSGWSFANEQYNNSGKVGFTFNGVADYTSAINSPTTNVRMIARHDDSADTVELDIGASNEVLGVGNIGAQDLNGVTMGNDFKNGTYTDDYLGDLLECAIWDAVLDDTDVSDILANGLNAGAELFILGLTMQGVVLQ